MDKKRLIRALVIVVGIAGAAMVFAFADDREQASASASGLPVPVMPPASDFVATVDNPYLPLTPGTTYRYEGTQDGGPTVDVVQVMHKTKRILGVDAVVVNDNVSVSGVPEEKTTDWYAQDRDGNVWYLGEDSFDNVNGKWVRNDGSWQAGVDGAQAGIIMEADPQVNDSYRQEYYPGHAEDLAKVLSTSATVSVTYGTFSPALQTKEWTPLERGVVEEKYYARGIGNVRTVMVKGGSEESHLVSMS